MRPQRVAAWAFAAMAAWPSVAASADPDDEGAPATSARPVLKTNRWQEDWSAFADPALRTQPLDGLKYLPLSADDPQRYASFGATLRDRFESNDAAAFGTAATPGDAYVLQRLQLHADLHLDAHLRLFAQLEDDRAWSKQSVSPVDQDRLDLRLAFAEYARTLAAGTVKARLGRQDFAFDLQRFVSSRDGPNVRQSFDAAWADWETPAWRFIGFASRPVQYRDDHPFDDHSNDGLRFDTLRIEHHVLGGNELSAYAARYQRRDARYGDAAGAERRDLVDARFAGTLAGFDWDAEAMAQFGRVGGKAIRAWAAGQRVGYTFAQTAWTPRAGLQADVASGDRQAGDGRVGTFNPLFPNGYYFSMAGYTGYANVVHVKPSLTLRPTQHLSVLLATATLWRQTAADSVYVQPNVPIAGTAGHGGRFTGRYEQLRADVAATRNVGLALEAVRYQAGAAIERAGGHDSRYVGVESKITW